MELLELLVMELAEPPVHLVMELAEPLVQVVKMELAEPLVLMEPLVHPHNFNEWSLAEAA
jgi:hypothetical protein